MDAQHKIALVTGGSRGLGKNTALRLSKSGMDVILTYRSKKEEAAEVVAQIEKNGQKAIALPLDVADTKSFDSFIQQVSASLQSVWGKEQFDFLINNAGINGVVVLPDILILLGTHVAGIIGPFSTRKLGLCSKRARW